MDITKYIGETTEYDKKQEVERRKVKNWLKSISAFANGGGGCLLSSRWNKYYIKKSHHVYTTVYDKCRSNQ